MIDIVKGIEPEAGYGAILKVSEAESAMRESRIRRTKTVCTYCGVGCSFDVWTKDRHILKIAPEHGPTNGISTCIKGKFGWDFVNSEDRLTSRSSARETSSVLLFRFVAAAYERRSLGIGSHWPFESWGRFLPEHTTAVSLLDRLLHHCHVVVTDGDSYRMKQARARGGATRKAS